MISLQQLLKTVIEQSASDLHLVVGTPPSLRVRGQVVRVKSDPLSEEDCQELCYSILTDYQKAELEERRELDFSFGIKDMARFRANFFFQKGHVSGVFRRIPFSIPRFEDLGLPKSISRMAEFPNGLVLVTGPTGSGKTTTIASLMDRINEERSGHIITLEDPIEYLFEHKKCIVNQREVGSDTDSFSTALRSALRQDPDYVLMGELRDLETIEAAIQVAETGHLVFATLHTNSAIQSINRIVNVFPSDQQDRIRLVLSFVLRGIISQRLMPTLDDGMSAVAEVLFVNSGIANLMRENKVHQIYSHMQAGQDKSGMNTFNQSLVKLILRRKIDFRAAFAISPDPDELDGLMKKAGI